MAADRSLQAARAPKRRAHSSWTTPRSRAREDVHMRLGCSGQSLCGLAADVQPDDVHLLGQTICGSELQRSYVPTAAAGQARVLPILRRRPAQCALVFPVESDVPPGGQYTGGRRRLSLPRRVRKHSVWRGARLLRQLGEFQFCSPVDWENGKARGESARREHRGRLPGFAPQPCDGFLWASRGGRPRVRQHRKRERERAAIADAAVCRHLPIAASKPHVGRLHAAEG